MLAQITDRQSYPPCSFLSSVCTCCTPRQVYTSACNQAGMCLQSFKNDPQLNHLPHTVIASWYQRRGYVTAMADLIQQSLQQFQEQVHSPCCICAMLVSWQVSLRCCMCSTSGLDSFQFISSIIRSVQYRSTRVVFALPACPVLGFEAGT